MSNPVRLDRALLEHLPYAAVLVDRETLRIVGANDAACERYGYSRDRLLAMKSLDLRVPDERHLVPELTGDMAAGPAVFGPFRQQTASGETIRTEIVTIPGELEGRRAFAAILVDATDRISAQTQARILFDRMPVAAWIHDCDTMEILAVNDAAVELYGYSREELLSMTIEQVRPDRDRRVAEELFRQHPTGDISRVHHHRRKDGRLIDVAAISTPIPFGRRNARLGAGRDVTQELAAERELQRANASLEEAQEITHLGSWQHDFCSSETRRSKELCRILGLHESQESHSIGSIYEHVHPADIGSVREAIESTADGELFTVEHRIVRGDGHLRWVSTRGRVQRDAMGYLESATATVLDITEQKKQSDELRYLAYHDQLTGLPNRQSMNAVLEKALAHGSAAVFFIDFDAFKEINDTFGHSMGDALLRQIAGRLAEIPGAETCRWGGDEFVVAAPLAPAQSHEDVLFKIRTALAASYEHDEQTFFITPSIGIALYPEHGSDPADLIRNADTAMYEAKHIKNTSALYRASMGEAARERLYVQNGLHEALQSDHLKLTFQPIVSASSGAIVAAEALIRWHDPVRGVQSPASFIGTAERTGLILPIGDWVVSEACRTLHALRSEGLLIPVSVNVASLQVDSNHIIESVRKWTAFYGVPPQSLHVEITESGIMRDVELAIGVMARLREMGVRIALDDFGAGYSSLSHLKSLPLDVMKIDKSLIRDLGSSERDRLIVRSVLQLAKATDLFVIAEGVETAEHVTVLRSFGCDMLQGFYFSEPLYLEEFFDYARSNNPMEKARAI